MKKKLTSAVALAMAMALTFGMTVCAAGSNNTGSTAGNTIVVDPITTTIVEPEGDEATTLYEESVAMTQNVSAVIADSNLTASTANVTPGAMKSAKETANVVAAKAVTSGKAVESATVIGAMDIQVFGTIPAEGVEVAITVPSIDSAKKYIILHYNGTAWETMNATVEGNTFYVTFTSFSPVVVVEVVEKDAPAANTNNNKNNNNNNTAAPAPAESPKTGETLPVAGVMAVICLAGAAVCAKKVRYSK